MTLDIKICGLSTPETVQAVLDRGATHIGFIFFAKSPRNVSAEQARDLVDPVRGKALSVAVSVNADDATLDHIVETMQPDMLQLHGSESPERVAEIKARHGLPVMKALPVREAADLAAIQPYRGIADRFLFDAKPPAGADLPGGNGISFDWTILSALDPDVDYMLSGGLNADNISDALRLTGAPGIDISSGVESQPGVKSRALINAFFDAVTTAQTGADLRVTGVNG